MRTISLLLALLVGILIAVVAIINNDVVTVNYVFGQMNLTLFMLILSSALAGALFMGFLSIFRSIQKYMKSQGDREYKKVLEERVKLLENEKKKLEDELKEQQKELKLAAEKAYVDLENEKKKLEDELKNQQFEDELKNQQKEQHKQAAEKAYADLENEKKKLEDELKNQQKEHDDITL